MNGRRLRIPVATLILLVMIFDGKTALSGAKEGVWLCLSTLVPSLFPFFVLSIYLTGALVGTKRSFLRSLGKALGLPAGAESVFLLGFLGGYPVGAQNIAQACKSGHLSRQDGERMLAFCSNAGPAFLFGIGATLFPDRRICFLLWGIHIVSALVVGLLTPKERPSLFSAAPVGNITLTAAMTAGLKATAAVCGWVVLFRMVIGFAQRWFLWLLPDNWQLTLIGLLELSNGSCQLVLSNDLGLRMQLFSLFLGFGGLCVFLQTRSVLAGSGLRGTAYFPGKAAQSAISYLLCVLAQQILPTQYRHTPLLAAPAAVFCVLYALWRIKIKNGSGISEKVIV